MEDQRSIPTFLAADGPGGEKDVLNPGRNCGRLETADRFAFLIDADAYFSALASAMERARRSIFIVSWDIDSRIVFQRSPKHRPKTLGAFLNDLASSRRDLHIYILNWDYLFIYARDREVFPAFRRFARRHRRIHFRFDGNHPVGACHHEKIAVVDDQVAFAGGMDLAKCRWDTPAHRPGDPRRVDPFGRAYEPVHDVQMVVAGPAAAALGDLVRERWRLATGRRPRKASPAHIDVWPEGLEPAGRGWKVAISLTRSGRGRYSPVREIESLYVDAVAAARTAIYIENQYLTSSTVVKALAHRLEEERGPEVVIVLPRRSSDWLEASTMGILRSRALNHLLEADRWNRLGVFYPDVQGLGNGRIKVHSKIMVVDDELLTVGSANLNNRSMGVDSECCLTLEAGRDPARCRIVSRFRNELLGEHLGVFPKTVEERLRDCGSLRNVIESVSDNGRRLKGLSWKDEAHGWANGLIPATVAIDPEEPIDPEFLIEDLVPGGMRDPGLRRVQLGVGILALLILLAAAWQWTPLHGWVRPEVLREAAAFLQGTGGTPWVLLAGYVAGSLVLVPVTLLILVTAWIWGPATGVLIALLGSTLGAAAGYGLGYVLGRDFVARLAGTRVDRMSRSLADHGILAVVALRILPLAPFTIVNMLAGAGHIRWAHFLIGTVLGMLPGIAAITIFETQLEQVILSPDVRNFAVLFLVTGMSTLGLILLRKWAHRRSGETESAQSTSS